MLKKIIPPLIAIVLDIWIHDLIEHQVAKPGLWVVLFFCGILIYQFLEWFLFKKEWDKYKKEFTEYKTSRSETGAILNQFEESNFILRKIANSSLPDLEFDKNLKKSKDYLAFHLYLSKIKYEKYLSSHFQYDVDSKFIRKVPIYYFQKSVWNKLIESSKIYLSLQILDSSTNEVYVRNDIRRDSEIVYLFNQLQLPRTKSRLSNFRKLFVVQDDWIDINNKNILNNDLKEYLTIWNNKFKDIKSKKAIIKVINKSQAIGAINGKQLDDIGIFDNILGIQTHNPNGINSFRANNVHFDFSFDIQLVKRYKNNFGGIFKSGIPLTDYLT